jgi:Tfp pilus assembly protein PilF
MRDGDVKSGIDVFKLVAVAYPDSADANDNLAGAYLKDGQKDLAKQHAEKALGILDSRKVPASSWTDTEEYRGEIRRDAEKILKELGQKNG